MAEETKWRVGHSNAWPPLQAAPLTAPFTIRGTVVKKYPLKVVLEEQVDVEDAKLAGMKLDESKKVERPSVMEYTAVEVVCKSFTRLPADGEDVDDRSVTAADFRSNMDAAFTEYWLGDDGFKASKVKVV